MWWFLPQSETATRCAEVFQVIVKDGLFIFRCFREAGAWGMEKPALVSANLLTEAGSVRFPLSFHAAAVVCGGEFHSSI